MSDFPSLTVSNLNVREFKTRDNMPEDLENHPRWKFLLKCDEMLSEWTAVSSFSWHAKSLLVKCVLKVGCLFCFCFLFCVFCFLFFGFCFLFFVFFFDLFCFVLFAQVFLLCSFLRNCCF